MPAIIEIKRSIDVIIFNISHHVDVINASHSMMTAQVIFHEFEFTNTICTYSCLMKINRMITFLPHVLIKLLEYTYRIKTKSAVIAVIKMKSIGRI